MKLNSNIDYSNIVSSISDEPRYDFGIYAKGYFNAAKSLTEKFLSSDSFSDYDGYPIVFLYHHAFELSMKNIIYKGARLYRFKKFEIMDSELQNKHVLSKLANLSSSILTNIYKRDDDLTIVIRNIRQIAIEFDELDKDSFSYRYPIDLKGNYSTKKHQILNISSLSNCMNELLSSLEVIDLGLDMDIYIARNEIDFESLFSEINNSTKK